MSVRTCCRGLEKRPIPVYNDVDDEGSPTEVQGLTYIRCPLADGVWLMS